MEMLRKYCLALFACALAFVVGNALGMPLPNNTSTQQDLDSLAKAYNNAGVDYMVEGNHEMASEMFVKSLRLRESIPNFPKARLANGYLNLAILKQDMSYIDSALFYYRKAESILLGMDNPPASTLGITYYAYGDCLNYKQDYKSAIAYIQKGINLLGQDSVANSSHLVLASIKLSAAYRGAGLLDEALDAANRSLELSKYFNNTYYSNALSASGLTYLAQKDYHNAIRYFKDVEKEIIKGERWRSSDLMALYSNLGATNELIGQFELAAFFYLKGIDISKSQNSYSPQLGLLLRNYALFLKSKGELDSAERYFIKSLGLNVKHQISTNFIENSLSNYFSPLIAIQCFEGLASIYLERFNESGHIINAQQSFQYFSKAIALMDEQRAGIYDDGDKLYIDDIYHTLYLNTIRACFTFSHRIPHAIEFAFKVSSKAKAAVLNQAIARERGLNFLGVPKDLVNHERELRQTVGTLYELYHEAKSKGGTSAKQLEGIEGRIFNAQREHKQLIASIEAKYPEYYALRYDTASVSIKDIQSKLSPSQVLIDYIVNDSSLISFAVAKEDFTWRHQRIGKEFFDTLEIFFNEINPKSFDDLTRENLDQYGRSSYYLYQTLLKPFESFIEGRDLVVVPHLQLSAIPFAALTKSRVANPKGYYALPYLVQSTAISYYPSTKLFYIAHNAKPKFRTTAISFAPSYNNSCIAHNNTLHYRQNLGSLPGAEREAREVSNTFRGKLVVGEQATEGRFKQEIANGEYGVLHLAMHTHIDESNPLFSKLIFSSSPDTTDDGFLNMYEVYGINLNAKLVIVSACRSSDGGLVKGEGLLSLARSFQYAGAQSLVAAQWRVEDYSGSEIMVEFTKNIKGGLPQDLALQSAQRKFLESADPLRSHPYFWASYQLIGYNGALFYPQWLKITIWCVSITLLLLLVFFIVRRSQLK